MSESNEVHVLWCNHKLRTVYSCLAAAVCDAQVMREKGYKDIYVSSVQVQPKRREADPLDPETIEALKRCVERS